MFMGNWDMERLQDKLKTKEFGNHLRLYDTVTSTQDIAHQWLAEGAVHGSLVIAEEQLNGRGRMGRSWHSPKGTGIYMSIVLKPATPLPYPPHITLLTAVALCRTIVQLTKLNVGIKWPNDLLINGRKISGILLELGSASGVVKPIVAGIGISANIREEDYPKELLERATSLFIESGQPVDRVELISLFLLQLEDLYELYVREGFTPIRRMWESLSVTLGSDLTLQTAKGSIRGKATGIDESGALIVQTEAGEEQLIYSGDIQRTP